MDGDGALDIVVANGRHWPEQNRIFLNDGRAGFTLARRLGDEEDGTYAAPLADFDGDGDLDIATGNDRTRNLVFLNDGAGRFERSGTFGTPSSTRSLTLADLDGDANTDILVVNRGRQNFIFRGDGAGAFDEGTPFGAGTTPRSMSRRRISTRTGTWISSSPTGTAGPTRSTGTTPASSIGARSTAPAATRRAASRSAT